VKYLIELFLRINENCKFATSHSTSSMNIKMDPSLKKENLVFKQKIFMQKFLFSLREEDLKLIASSKVILFALLWIKFEKNQSFSVSEKQIFEKMTNDELQDEESKKFGLDKYAIDQLLGLASSLIEDLNLTNTYPDLSPRLTNLFIKIRGGFEKKDKVDETDKMDEKKPFWKIVFNYIEKHPILSLVYFISIVLLLICISGIICAIDQYLKEVYGKGIVQVPILLIEIIEVNFFPSLVEKQLLFPLTNQLTSSSLSHDDKILAFGDTVMWVLDRSLRFSPDGEVGLEQQKLLRKIHKVCIDSGTCENKPFWAFEVGNFKY